MKGFKQMNETDEQLVPVHQNNLLAVVKKKFDITEKLLKKIAAEKAKLSATISATDSALIENPICKDLQTCFTDPVTGMDFVYVKGGTFIMGYTFDDGDDGDKIRLLDMSFPEALIFNKTSISVLLEGGYVSGFANNSGKKSSSIADNFALLTKG